VLTDNSSVSSEGALVAVIVGTALFALGCALILNPANLTARMHQRNIDRLSSIRNPAIRSWLYPNTLVPLWVVRYGVGLWFCVGGIAYAVAAGRSL
jgi:hypothetical protein